MSDLRAIHMGDGAFVVSGATSLTWCAENLGEGEVVTIRVVREREMRSHRHYFASIEEAWKNLPEELEDAPYAVSSDALRKHALIATGHCKVVTATLSDEATAQEHARFLRRELMEAHGYAVVVARGNIIRCFTPLSQKLTEMDAETFQQSKKDTLEWISKQIGTSAADLHRAAG
jgi:hypothetical protein